MKILNYILVFFFFFGFGNFVRSQLYYKTVKEGYEVATKLKEATLLVVIDDDTANSLYKSINSAYKENWTFSKYSFIKSSEIESYSGQSGYYIASVYGQYFEGTKDDKFVNYAYLIKSANPIKGNSGSLEYICLPGCKYGKAGELTVYDYEYLLPLIVRTWNNNFEYFYNSGGKTQVDFKDKYTGERKGLLQTYYNQGMKKIPKMKIYFCDDNITDTTKTKGMWAKALKIEETSMYFASSSKLKEIIAAKAENTALLVNGDIYSIKDAELLMDYGMACTYGKCP